MDKKRNKTILLNSLIFVFCVVIIILYCLVPPAKKPEVAKLQTYQVVFDTDGGTIISSISVEEGHSIEAPPTPTKEGYIFDGWVVDDVSYDFSQIISGDVVLKARWREVSPDTVIYTVRFETEGGTTYPEQFIEENGKVVQPSEPVRDGYKFVEWQVDGNPYNFDNPVTSNLTIVAKWEEEDENKTYTVTFDLNGGKGSKPANQTVKTGERATVPSERPTHNNSYYKFNGWSTNRNASSANIEAVTIRNDTTFYAVWQDTTPTWTVKINLNSSGQQVNGSCNTSQSVKPGGHPSGCNNLSRSGYKLTSWTYLGRTYDSLEKITIDSKPEDSNPIYAQWTPIKNYTLTLNFGEGSKGNCNSPLTYSGIEDSHTFSWSCTPTAPRFFKFTGWSNGSTSYTMNANGTNNSATVTAQYSSVTYSATCVVIPNDTGGATKNCKPSVSGGDVSGLCLKVGDTCANLSDNNRKVVTSSYNHHASAGTLKVCLASDTSVCSDTFSGSQATSGN